MDTLVRGWLGQVGVEHQVPHLHHLHAEAVPLVGALAGRHPLLQVKSGQVQELLAPIHLSSTRLSDAFLS